MTSSSSSEFTKRKEEMKQGCSNKQVLKYTRLLMSKNVEDFLWKNDTPRVVLKSLIYNLKDYLKQVNIMRMIQNRKFRKREWFFFFMVFFCGFFLWIFFVVFFLWFFFTVSGFENRKDVKDLDWKKEKELSKILDEWQNGWLLSVFYVLLLKLCKNFPLCIIFFFEEKTVTENFQICQTCIYHSFSCKSSLKSMSTSDLVFIFYLNNVFRMQQIKKFFFLVFSGNFLDRQHQWRTDKEQKCFKVLRKWQYYAEGFAWSKTKNLDELLALRSCLIEVLDRIGGEINPSQCTQMQCLCAAFFVNSGGVFFFYMFVCFGFDSDEEISQRLLDYKNSNQPDANLEDILSVTSEVHTDFDLMRMFFGLVLETLGMFC